MTVRELMKAQKYKTPIRVCGGSDLKHFFSARLDDYYNGRKDFAEKFGKFEVHYFYYETNYEVFKRLSCKFPKLFHWINPQVLVIELVDCEEVDRLKETL